MKLLSFLLAVAVGIIATGITAHALVQSFGPLPATAPKVSVAAVSSPNPTPLAAQPTAASAPAANSSVTAEITNVKRDKNSTVIALALNNHQFDLATFDATARTKLANVRPMNYRIIQSASGGHHVQSELTFPGSLSGTLALGLGDNFTFTLNVP